LLQGYRSTLPESDDERFTVAHRERPKVLRGLSRLSIAALMTAMISSPFISLPLTVAVHRVTSMLTWTYVAGARLDTRAVPEWGGGTILFAMGAGTVLSIAALARAPFRDGARRANVWIAGTALALSAGSWALVWLLSQMAFPGGRY
jgi:hypothetical protein